MKHDYRITISTTTEHTYIIPDCNSDTEAEDIATHLFLEGEDGDISIVDYDIVDSCPVEEDSMGHYEAEEDAA